MSRPGQVAQASEAYVQVEPKYRYRRSCSGGGHRPGELAARVDRSAQDTASKPLSNSGSSSW